MIRLAVFLLFLPSLAFAKNLYEMGPVEYFSHATKSSHPAGVQDRIDWPEPGPPPAVRLFLDDPKPQTAKIYLEWEHRKFLRILKAQQVLEKLALDKEGSLK